MDGVALMGMSVTVIVFREHMKFKTQWLVDNFAVFNQVMCRHRMEEQNLTDAASMHYLTEIAQAS